MKNTLKNATQKIDLYFILLMSFVYIFLNVVIFVGDTTDLSFIILLNVLFVLTVLSYFTSIVFCLISCILFIFSYGSYILYSALILQKTASTMSYLWIVIIPLCCILVAFFRTNISEVEQELVKFNIASETLVGFDESTNLLNERMFYYELKRYMAMASRDYIKVTLVLIKLKYFDSIVRLIGEKAMTALMRDIGAKIGEFTRVEDIQFFVDEKGVYSLILISDEAGAAIVRDRLKNGVKEIEMQEKVKLFSLHLELKIGIAQYNSEITSVQEFRDFAEKNMEFDV